MLRVIGLSILLPPLMVLLTWAMPAHQAQQALLRSSFSRQAHPAASEPERSLWLFGIVAGSGSYCHAFAGEQRRSSLSPQEVRNFYADYPDIWLYHPGLRGEESFLPGAIRHRVQPLPPDRYIVYALEDAWSPSGDLRCS